MAAFLCFHHMMAVEVCVFLKDLSRWLSLLFFFLKVWDYSTGQLIYQSGVLTGKFSFLYILFHRKMEKPLATQRLRQKKHCATVRIAVMGFFQLSLWIGGFNTESCILIKYLICVYSGNNFIFFEAAFPLLSLLIDEENKQIITGCAEGQVRITH